MAAPFPSLAELAAEEAELQVAGCTDDDAGDPGSAPVAATRRDGAPWLPRPADQRTVVAAVRASLRR